MNINIYLEDELGQNLGNFVQKSGKTRNSIIREAIKDYIARQSSSQWSEKILGFEGIGEGIEFESYRDDLLSPDDNGVFS